MVLEMQVDLNLVHHGLKVEIMIGIKSWNTELEFGWRALRKLIKLQGTGQPGGNFGRKG